MPGWALAGKGAAVQEQGEPVLRSFLPFHMYPPLESADQHGTQLN